MLNYFDAAKKRDLKVKAVVYLSKDGKREPDGGAFDDRGDVKNVLLRVAAFANKTEDLVNGWLQPLLEEAKKSGDLDLAHLLIQYIEILEEIGEHMMNTDVQKQFMHLLRQNKVYRMQARTIADLYNRRLAFAFEELAGEYSTEEAKRKFGVYSAKSESGRYPAAFIDVVTLGGAAMRIGIFDYGDNRIRVTTYSPEERGEEALRGLQDEVSKILRESFQDKPTMWYEWPEEEDRLKSAINSVLQLLSQAR